MTTPLPKTIPTPNTPKISLDSCCLGDIVKKVGDVVLSRWGLVLAAGIATGLAMGVMWGAAATAVLGLAAWFFAPVSTDAAKQAVGEFLFLSANVLGIFSDPFEFEGDYGEFINQVKQQVEDRLIGASMQNDHPTEAEINKDLRYGPTVAQMFPTELQDHLRSLCRAKGLNLDNLNRAIANFFPPFQNGKPFYFFKNCPSSLLSVDLRLRILSKNRQEMFPLAIVNSSVPILGDNTVDSCKNLADQIFTTAIRDIVNSKDITQQFRAELDENMQNYRIGNRLVPRAALEAFATAEGQMLFYYLYQIMNIYLVADIIPQINQAKREFAETMGSPQRRAETLSDQIVASGADVIFTQECDLSLTREMERKGYFSTYFIKDGKGQSMLRSPDGSVIFLKKSRFKEAIVSEPYDEQADPKHKATIIIAEELDNDIPLVFASCHGDAKEAKDARLQIMKVHDVYQKCLARNPKAQMAIGIDANPKNAAEMTALERIVEGLNFIMSKVGVTTIKKRKVTPQREKTNRLDNEAKDAMIVSKGLAVKEETVAFAPPPLAPETRLPNRNIVSDHAPVGMRVALAAG